MALAFTPSHTSDLSADGDGINRVTGPFDVIASAFGENFIQFRSPQAQQQFIDFIASDNLSNEWQAGMTASGQHTFAILCGVLARNLLELADSGQITFRGPINVAADASQARANLQITSASNQPAELDYAESGTVHWRVYAHTVGQHFLHVWSEAMLRNVMTFSDDGTIVIGAFDPPADATRSLIGMGVGNTLHGANANGTLLGAWDSDNTGCSFIRCEKNDQSVAFEAGHSNVYHGGDMVSLVNGKGPVFQSPNGHYWRVNVSNTGVLSTTDLGTSPP